MNPEEEIEKIIEKYGMHTNDLLRDRLAFYIRKVIKDAVDVCGNKVIVHGVKKQGNNQENDVVSMIAQLADVIGVVDKMPFSDKLLVRGNYVPFINKEELKYYEFNIYIIHSFYQSGEIYLEVKDELECRGIRIIDLYWEIRRDFSFSITKAYGEYGRERDFSLNLLNEALCGFRENGNINTYRRLLGTCLALRDFVSFFRYAEEGETLIADNNDIDRLICDVKNLLIRIKQAFSIRKAKDIILHWVDQISYDELKFMPKLQTRLQQGFMFENAFTVSPYTKPTVQLMFWKEFRGIGEYDTGGSYKKKLLDDSEMYHYIQEAGYKFECFGLLEKIIKPDCYDKEKSEKSVSASIHYWDAIVSILTSQNPVFGMVHIVEETHDPYASPEVDLCVNTMNFSGSYETVAEKIRISAAYADELIDFYSDLMGEKTVGIYMSDHGKWEDVTRRRFQDIAMHTFLGITHAGITGRTDVLFSYQYFGEFIMHFLKLVKPCQMFFCDIPIYGRNTKMTIVKKGMGHTDICSGYKGIRTLSDKYVKLDDGSEHYFKLPDEQNDRINDKQYKERIEYLRQQCIDREREIMSAEEDV